MKHIFSFLLTTLLGGALFAQIKTPAASPFATISQAVGLATVTVEYSRPSVNGREIFGNLVPFGKVWRTGANKITTIRFDQDVEISGQAVKAGSYGWYTIPGDDVWVIALNSDDKQWGAYAYDEKKDILRFKVAPEKVNTVEQLTIAFENYKNTRVEVVLSWANTAVRFDITQNPHELIMAQIKEKTSKPDCTADTYFDAADYYYEHNLDLKQALLWADKVVEKDVQYWTLQLRARILHKMGLCDRAKADAQKSLDMAKKEGDDSYVKKNEAILNDCK